MPQKYHHVKYSEPTEQKLSEDCDKIGGIETVENFLNWINIIIPGENKRYFGQTQIGQWFCFVLEKTLGFFEVRLYMDEDHRYHKEHGSWYKFWNGDVYIEKKTFLSNKSAIEYITKRKLGLENNLLNEKLEKRIRKMPKDCVQSPEKYLKPGDHIQSVLVSGLVHHEGIYIGNGKVIHISVDKESFGHAFREKHKASARIGQIYPNFAETLEDDIKVVVYRIRLRKPEEIVSFAHHLAKEDFRRGEYNLLLKNCQHFASLCATGLVEKEEMTDKTNLIVTGLAIGGVSVAIVFGVVIAIITLPIAMVASGSADDDED